MTTTTGFDSKTNQDGSVTYWYDLDPGASELWVVEGPVGIDPKSIDPDHLPPGFRWVSNEEWAANPDRQP